MSELQRAVGFYGWNVGAERYISGLAADRFGNIFVVYQGEIWRYLDEFNVPGGVPFGIEFDNQGNLWVVTSKPQVLKFKVHGA